jgi:hypothetical protein
MKIVWKRKACNMTLKAVKNISESNSSEVFINTKESPFLYLNILKDDYGMSASARPVIKGNRLIGYKFKTTA